VLLGVFNLLPILPLDGGKIIKEILNDRIGFFSTKCVIRIVTAITAGFIAAAGVYQLLRSKNVSLLVIAVFLFFDLNNTEPEDSFMTMKNIIYRRMRMQKKGIYPARDLAVLKTTPIGEVLKNLDFDRYHLIFVLGDRLEPVKILGEQEVLDGIIKYGINISFGEFIEK
jgi:stage IV sporulation protein FB